MPPRRRSRSGTLAGVAVDLEQFLGVAGEPVRVVEHSPSGPAAFWERFRRAAPWLRVAHRVRPAGEPSRTELDGARPHGAIRYEGDIDGRQLAPLAETLRALATGHVDADTPATAALLGELQSTVTVQVVVSPTCPFCPSVAAAALRFACSSIRVDVEVLWADRAAMPAGVGSVPTVLVAGQVVATGAIGEYDLAERVVAATAQTAAR